MQPIESMETIVTTWLDMVPPSNADITSMDDIINFKHVLAFVVCRTDSTGLTIVHAQTYF